MVIQEWSNYSLNTFDEVVVNTTVPLNPEAEMFSVKSTLSGHGFGNGNNCGEFCNNTHKVLVNGVEQYSWEIMQECGGSKRTVGSFEQLIL